MKGKTLVGAGSNMGNSTTPGGALTPAEAAKECETAAKQSGNGNPIKNTQNSYIYVSIYCLHILIHCLLFSAT